MKVAADDPRRDLARATVTSAIAENIRFRVGVLGSTVEERRQYAGQIVEILERPFLARAVGILAGCDCGPLESHESGSA